MVTITYGANETQLEGFVGRSVGDIRLAFAAIGVGADDPATLNGRRASDADVLADGDELAFVKATAQKG